MFASTPDRRPLLTGSRQTAFRRLTVVVALLFLAAACSSAGETSADSETTAGETGAGENGEAAADETRPTSLTITNQGGDMEGHTPRGFAGSGTGLFIGDNLNANFPDGEGIQLLLTFDLPDDVDEILSASLTSDVMEVRGDPFNALGDIEAEPVTYTEFGPPLFELEADGDPVNCLRVGPSGLICDVTQAAADGVAAGKDRLQFRLQFQNLSDSDGEPDLALFYLTDTNSNERGIFTLNLRR